MHHRGLLYLDWHSRFANPTLADQWNEGSANKDEGDKVRIV